MCHAKKLETKETATMASSDHQAARPLAVLFERARAVSSAALEGGSSSSSSSSDALDAAIAACSAAESAADAAGVSPSASAADASETADDLPARDLRWVLVPGWDGLLRSRRASSSPGGAAASRSSSSSSPRSLAAKRSALLEASERLRGFLSACQRLGAAPNEALATLREADDGAAEEEDGEDDEHGGGGGGRGPLHSVGASNPEARRAAKIAAFRARRELQAKLSQLREKAEKRKKKKKEKGVSSSSAARKEGDELDDEGDDDDDDDDEEELREAVLAEIALTCLSAADEVLAIKEEATVLRHALLREREAEARGGGRGDGAGAAREDGEERARREEAAAVAAALRGAFSALSSGGGEGAARRPTFAPASAGTVSASALGGLGLGTSGVFDRGAAAASVFRPSHLFPTMGLEEFADREVTEARARSEADRARRASAAAAASSRSSADDGGDDTKTEADGGAGLDRLRALDDWKDDHPYGYGNSKRRPAATGSK